jgi:pimeloyl-ACP methyl ester carboxylesterase
VFEKLKLLQYGAKVKLHAADKMRMINSAGRQIQLLRAGRGEPLVYLHSALGETLWLPFHQQLSERFEVFAPAHPGFAQSSGYDEIDGIEDVIFHYLDLFATLNLERFHLVGASLGGWIAAEFAVRYPERIRRLVLVDAAGLWLDESPIPDFFTRLQEPAEMRKLLLNAPDSFVGDLLFPVEPEGPGKMDEERLEAALKAMQATARLGWNPFMHNPKLRGRLRRITCPTLLLWGEQDRLVSPAYAQAFHAAIPNSELKLIPNCGHLPMFEQEDDFVSAVASFLQAADQRR